MKTAVTATQMVLRLTWAMLLVLGVLFVSGHSLALIPVHMLIGLVLVLSLWVLASFGAAAGVKPALVGLTIFWGFLVLVLGMTQSKLMVGQAHWVIQVLHLLVGTAAIGLGEAIGIGIKRANRARTEASLAQG